MHILSRLIRARFAGALALPVALAGCTGTRAIVDPGAVTPVAVAPVAPVAMVPVQPAAVAPAAPGGAYGSYCSAGFYHCNLPAAGPIGSQCTCPGLGGPSWPSSRQGIAISMV